MVGYWLGHIPLLTDYVAENVINLINESLQYSTVHPS